MIEIAQKLVADKITIGITHKYDENSIFNAVECFISSTPFYTIPVVLLRSCR